MKANLANAGFGQHRQEHAMVEVIRIEYRSFGWSKNQRSGAEFSRRFDNDYVTDAILAAAKNDNWEKMHSARQQFDVYLAGNCSFWFRVNEFDFRCRSGESEPSAPGRRAGPL